METGRKEKIREIWIETIDKDTGKVLKRKLDIKNISLNFLDDYKIISVGEDKFDIYYYDDVNGWEPQDANQDCASNTLTLEVEHFSSYAAIAIRDSDGDDVLDPNDNCMYVQNPSQADTDNDGIGDLCECDAANIDTIDPVDFEDFTMLVLDWLSSGTDLVGDTNRDGSVNAQDLLQVTEHWLSNCGQP